jgi:histidinol-phosphatase
MHQLFHACRGDGAYRDGHRIRVSAVDTLADSLLCYSSISWFRKNGREAAFLDLAAKTDRQRGYGDFLGFLFVAQGSAELMIDHGVHPWDVVALVPIVEEAGGVMTAWDHTRTTQRPDVIASNGRLHAEALRTLNG